MNNTEQIVGWLKAKQVELKEHDAAFARRLGVTRQAWQMTRTGVTRPGPQMLTGVVGAFPELTYAVQSLFVPENARILTSTGKDAGQ